MPNIQLGSKSASPRILIWSPRGVERGLYRCGQAEYEDVICAVDDVHLLAPSADTRGQTGAIQKLRELSMRFAKVDIAFQPQFEEIKLERDYDLFFFYAQSLDDLHRLKRLRGWRKHCKKAICLLEEVWQADLSEGWIPRELRKFDALVIGLQGSVEPLRKLTGLPCHWLAPGVDALRFFPGHAPPERTIDIYSMGRRSEVSHRALLAQSNALGWTYLFDTVEARGVRDSLREHRVQLAELVKRTRYFIVNKARIDNPQRIGNQIELAFRSFEGAAGGAIMIGATPDDPSSRELFDWPDAHIHVPYNATSIAQLMTSLDAQPERVERARRNNIVNSLLRHDWAYRWRSVLEIAGLPVPRDLLVRMDQLKQTAGTLESAPLLRTG